MAPILQVGPKEFGTSTFCTIEDRGALHTTWHALYRFQMVDDEIILEKIIKVNSLVEELG